MASPLRAAPALTILVAVLLCVLPAPAVAATMPAVAMKFVDAQDNSPIVGAHVLFQATGREGTWTGHGGKTASLFAVEGVTDGAGAVRFAKQEFSTQPFFLNTNYENPSMVVLKPGYVLLVLISGGVPHEAKTVTTWDYNNQTITMKRGTEADIPVTVSSADIYAGQAMVGDGLCGWKKIPRFLVALDRMATPGIGPTTSRLQFLFMNDGLFVQKGCGSPKAFFAPYLR